MDTSLITYALLNLFVDSLVQETTRLSSGVFMVRYVTKDTNFETETGQKYLIREGDRIAIYPPAIHKDPEIFEDPLVTMTVFSAVFVQYWFDGYRELLSVC